MGASEFVSRLVKLVHSSEYYINKGLSIEEANEMVEDEKKSLLLRPKSPESPEIEDPIEDLICRYDTSELEIGMIYLGKKTSACHIPSDKVLVGSIEADPLVINKKNGEIELLDHAQPDCVMAKCAASGGQFLEALLLLASFEPEYTDFYGDLPETQAKENNEAARKKAMECAKVAGVSTKSSIYEMLLGYDSRIQ